jgi:thiamine-monophosphate kinase
MTRPGPPPAGGTVGEAGERALLQRLRARIPASPDVPVGPGDDAAVLRTGAETLLTTDTLVEGVHFRRPWSSPRRVGRKALSVNLSDVGAMGGRSRFATVSLCLPAGLEVAWLDGLYDGLLQRAAETGVALVGGNLSATSGPIVIDVAVLGESARPLRRAGAHPGDRIVVTGAPGSAAAGLALLEAGLRLRDDGGVDVPAGLPRPSREADAALRACLAAQLDPAPPLALAAALAPLPGVHAAMDVSDGLSGDLLALCAESGLAAAIAVGALPDAVAPLEAWGVGEARALYLHGGEDYGLLLAVAPEDVPALQELARAHGTTVSDIGGFEAGAGVWLQDADGRRPLAPQAHQHFSPGATAG